jgi:hypothetical protein
VLKRRIELFVALPLEKLSGLGLRDAVSKIGAGVSATPAETPSLPDRR